MITIRLLLAALLYVAAAATTASAASVSAGYGHSLALAADGTVRSWGDDSWGALGVGRPLANPTPTPVLGLTNVIQVVAGDEYTAALKADGSVWTWGRNENGQLGDGTLVTR